MKNSVKKITIILATIIVVLFLVGFLYPLFTSNHIAVAPASTQNLGEKIINDIKQVANVGETAQVSNAIVADATNTKEIPVVEKVATSTPLGALPIYFGVSRDNLIDDSKFPDGDTIYSMIRTLASAPSTSRMMNTTSFTAANPGYYVYFAWPTSFENNDTYSCKAITLRGRPTGSVDCFSSGLADSLLFNTTDLEHRELPHFTDDNGKIISYEIYRAHYFISPGSTIYYKTF